MVIHLKRIVEKRKYELNTLLRRNDVDRVRKHQLKGALNEVDFFLKTLDDYDEERKNNSGD